MSLDTVFDEGYIFTVGHDSGEPLFATLALKYLVRIADIFTGLTAAKLFAWPVLNLTAYANYTNYNDQVTNGR